MCAENDIMVATNGWGDARIINIHAVLSSAMSQFTPHLQTVAWPGIYVFQTADIPITLTYRSEEDRVQIGLATHNKLWCQYAFQFSHEFVHLMVRHLNRETEQRIVTRHPDWLEESLCEAGSLFALRSMSRDWQTNAPYPNWVEYGKEFNKYVQERLDSPKNSLPPGTAFDEWLKSKETDFRTNSCNREANTIVAKQMLPVFEQHPAAWETVIYLLAADHDPSTSTDNLFMNWRDACPGNLRPYVNELAKVLGLHMDRER